MSDWIGSNLWVVLLVAGPLLLLIVMAWAVRRNRTSRIPDEVSEAGARRVYAHEEELRRRGADGEEGR